MFSRIFLVISFFCFSLISAYPQTATFTTTGNWNDPTRWASSNIGDDITEDVTINVSTAFISTGLNYTIGNLTFLPSSSLAIANGSTLEVGASGTPGNVLAGNNVTISGSGNITIWGNITASDVLTLNVTGTITIKGDLIMDDGARISVLGGNILIEGNFIGDDDTDVTFTSGQIVVVGYVDVGINSDLAGPPGSFIAGACAQGSGSNYCGSSVMPIELAYFNVGLGEGQVLAEWATEMEEFFDRFELEKASNDLVFSKIADIQSQATGEPRMFRKYSFLDPTPYIGNNYYRLKAVDLDGSYQYFQVQQIFYEGDQAMQVYPNPIRTSEVLTINIPFTPTPQDKVSLMTMQGVEVINTTIETIGENEISLGGKIKPGLYVLRYNSPALRKTFKVVVQ
jgi:hypothetical protein